MTIHRSPFPDIAIPEQTISACVFAGFAGREDEPVLIDGPTGRSLTGRQLVDAVRRLAGGLTARGFGAGHVVAIMAPNLPEYAVLFHGVAWAGGTVTPVNPSYTADELRFQLAELGRRAAGHRAAVPRDRAGGLDGHGGARDRRPRRRRRGRDAVRRAARRADGRGGAGRPRAARAGHALFVGDERAAEGRDAEPRQPGGERRPDPGDPAGGCRASARWRCCRSSTSTACSC